MLLLRIERYLVPYNSIIPFLMITFGISWGIFALYIFFPECMEALFGSFNGNHPLYFIAVYSPAISAFIVVARTSGIAGLCRFFSRLFMVRCSLFWWVFLIAGIPLLFFAASGLQGGFSEYHFHFESVGMFLIASFLMLIKGPIEEFGWRGLALPLLQRRVTPFSAGLILGVIWGLWHLPAFILSGTPLSEWSFFPFFVGTISVSLIGTSLFNQSQGSIFLAALFHFQLVNPLWPDAQPYDMYLFAIFALLVVLFDRKAMFSSDEAVTEVVPGEMF